MMTSLKLHRHLFLTAALCASPWAIRAQSDFNVLHTFPSAGPHFPMCTLVETSPGIFYGTTSAGPGSGVPGDLFGIDSSGNIRYLHAFDGATEGNLPEDTLLQAFDGTLYGITIGGGSGQNGTIFKSDLAGNVSVLYSFSAQPNTITPYSLIQTPKGVLYGTLSSFDPSVPSQVYVLNRSGQPVTLHAFKGTEGAPAGPLTFASDGNLYGLSNNGSVYRITPSGKFTTIYTFTGNDGATPIGNLSQAGNGRLYGVNAFGGANNYGTLFSVSLAGSFRLEHTFTGGADGGFPLTGTARADDGNVYGTTGLVPGTDFQITTAGQFTTLATMGPGGNPNFTSPAVIQGSDGLLYGVQTTFGGTVYTLNAGLAPPKPAVITFRPSSGPVGTAVLIVGGNLLGATAVSFNGTAAGFRVASAKSIYTVVPPGATTGPISVETPNGGTSTTSAFTVTP
ncbi:MAG TPA: choice-of-anchor tandem repeat GloVer-containing protein [Bryobacteraceae bacterium]|nr:choice-of-anchor tandem repeat GloVer-containing protein [Bryobacteraceae bacterium]